MIPTDTAAFEAAFRSQAQADGVTHFCTGIAILDQAKLLVARRVPDDEFGGIYEIPGGGVDDGEDFWTAAIREALEETGVDVRLTGMFPGFDYRTRSKPKVRQINFLAEAIGDLQVRLEPNEHDDFRWITAADIDTLQSSPEMKTCLHSVFAAL